MKTSQFVDVERHNSDATSPHTIDMGWDLHAPRICVNRGEKSLTISEARSLYRLLATIPMEHVEQITNMDDMAFKYVLQTLDAGISRYDIEDNNSKLTLSFPLWSMKPLLELIEMSININSNAKLDESTGIIEYTEDSSMVSMEDVHRVYNIFTYLKRLGKVTNTTNNDMGMGYSKVIAESDTISIGVDGTAQDDVLDDNGMYLTIAEARVLYKVLCAIRGTEHQQLTGINSGLFDGILQLLNHKIVMCTDTNKDSKFKAIFDLCSVNTLLQLLDVYDNIKCNDELVDSLDATQTGCDIDQISNIYERLRYIKGVF